MTRTPRRTCVACRAVREKSRLVRLVRETEGVVVVDPTGRAAGRGAYVCADARCAGRLVKGDRLSQAFRRPCRAGAGLVSAVPGVDATTGPDRTTDVNEHIAVISRR